MQTSIEWFIENLLGNGLLRLTKEEHRFYSELRDKAKEMHKQEIETLYTEEQVRKVIEQSYSLGSAYRGVYSKKLENEIIQSLKQTKKINKQ
jgi:hypothetical protein